MQRLTQSQAEERIELAIVIYHVLNKTLQQKIKHFCLFLCFHIIYMAFSLELSELLNKCNNTAVSISHIRNLFSRSDSYICDLLVLRGQSFLMQSQYAPKKDPIHNSWQSYRPEMAVLKCAWSISMMSWVSGNVHNSGLWVTLFCCPTCAVRPFVQTYLCRDTSVSAGLACSSSCIFFGEIAQLFWKQTLPLLLFRDFIGDSVDLIHKSSKAATPKWSGDK